MDSEECELRYGAIDGYEDAVWANPTDIQRGPVLMPSDLAAAPAGTGPVTIRQMTPEERARYQPNRPTRDDLADDLAAGLSAPEIARKWAVPVERVHALIRYYRLRKTAAEETETKKQELAEIRERIKAELAEKKARDECRVNDESPVVQTTQTPEMSTENPEMSSEMTRTGKGMERVPRTSMARNQLTREVLERELQELSVRDVSVKYKCSQLTLRKLMAEYGIKSPMVKIKSAPQTREITSPVPVTESFSDPAPVPPQTSVTAIKSEAEVRQAPKSGEDFVPTGLNLTARGTYSADRLHRILAGIMAAVQEAGGEFAAHIEVRGRDAGGQTG